jgi:Mg-chelatase subunit ChlD
MRRGARLPRRLLVGGAIACLALSLALASACGNETPAPPQIDTSKPALIFTSKSRLAKAIGQQHVARIVELADTYGDVIDVDPIIDSEYAAQASSISSDTIKYIATLDEIVEKRFDKAKYSCILMLGGESVLPMGQVQDASAALSNNGTPLDGDIQYTDDVYGDLDHDALMLPDVPVARIPDGKDHTTMEAQLTGTQTRPSGGMVRYNQARPGGPEVGKAFGASVNEKVPPVEDAGVNADLQHYFFILHGDKTTSTWTADDPSGKAKLVVGLRAKKATAHGIVWSSACYGAYMIDETATGDVGLHFLAGGTRGFVASPSMTYSAQEADYTTRNEGGLAKLFFERCTAGETPLLALFNAKYLYAATVGAERQEDFKTIHQFNYFGAPLTAASVGDTPAPSPQPSPSAGSGESDTELVMDVSGSMGDEMSGVVKLDAAKSAANSIVSMIRNESMTQEGSNGIGLVSFTTEAQVDQPLGADYDGTTEAITAMTPQDSTNLGDGLEKALGSLSGSATTRSRMIIVLSDGQSNEGMTTDEILSGPVARAASAGIKIYTVGFGDSGDIDEELLRQIADLTGGEYYYADEAFKLENVYIKLRHKSGGTVLGDYNGTSSAAAQQVGAFSVDAVTGELHGTLNSDGGEAQVVLKDPDGRSIDGDYPGAILFEDSQPAYVIVKNPQPGAWKAFVKATDGSTVTYDVIVSARGTRQPVHTYTTLLALVTLGATVLALGIVAVFRWPIRSPKS